MKNLEHALRTLSIHPALPKMQHRSSLRSGYHCRKNHAFTYVLEGGFALTIGDNNYIVQKNQLVFLPPHQPYLNQLLPGVPLKLIHFTFVAEIDNEDLFSFYDLDKDTHVVHAPEEFIMEIYNHMVFPADNIANTPHRILWCAEIARLCSFYIQERISIANSKKDFTDVISYMKEHLTEDIPLETLSSIAHLNSTYFSEKFKAQMGLSPMKYLAKLRVDKAAKLLKETEDSLSEIGKNIGITNPYYFQTYFKKHLGISPEKYRELFSVFPIDLEDE